MASEIGVRSIDYGEDLVGNDLGFLLRERQKDTGGYDLFRSPSAPPTVDGSLLAAGGILSGTGEMRGVTEEEFRSDPAYVDYYYSNVNMNPRLPPPLQSKEDWRFAQRVNGSGGGTAPGLGGIGDRRRMVRGDELYSSNSNKNGINGMNSLFSIQPAFNKEENGMNDLRKGGEWNGVGLPGLGLGNKQKSIAEIIQDDMNQTTPPTRIPSRPASRNAFDEIIATSEAQFAPLSSSDTLHPSANGQGISVNSNSASVTYASALGGSLSRSTTPDPNLIARAPSPRIPTAGEGRVNSMEKRNDLVAALSGMNISNSHGNNNHIKPNSQLDTSEYGSFQHPGLSHSTKGSYSMDQNYYGLAEHHKHSGPNSPSNFHSIGSPSSAIPNYSLSGHSINPALASMMAGQLGSGSFPNYESVGPMDSRTFGGSVASRANLMAELQNLSRAESLSQVDPMYLRYLASTDHHTLNNPSIGGGASYMDLLALQNAYLGMLSSQKTDCGRSYLGKSAGLNHGYYGNSGHSVNSPYAGNSFLSSLLPNSPLGSLRHHGERNMRMHSGMRNYGSDVMGNWCPDSGGFMDKSFGSSLLDEFKSNKTKCFELSEIAGHVVEFSADQYGSRFIQQKLETATTDEKNMVFHEIIPQALSLMTDVFGNYVIQKFFEHGTAPQVRELADKLTGRVLDLSLQMYGCRVIQKAIEVVDLDQQKEMVVELDGHIMRCVRDQNGNHVIQKCIECIPEDAIQFIISTFYDQVVTLSTHPYGCRVIQRVLEHCHDETTQQVVMDEIMQSVCMLAQDQYGNYVVQHVLEHGKPHERSSIISKFTGKIVQMSQQKFASNVIEKCLAFGDATERRTIVNEMLGTTDENEPLQVMMKDQFANYVVQKVLETCDDQQLEVILSRIKVHLNALKKYTYGKHIVARVEKLVAAGERRISLQLQSPSA